MARPTTLTSEQKIENKKKLNKRIVRFIPPDYIKEKLEKLSASESNNNEPNLSKTVLELVKTHPKFKNFKI